MDLMYILISSLLSLSAAMLMAVPLNRLKKSALIFSVALGIIIFRCIKSIFIECGWGFAALFGVRTGIFVQVTVFFAALVFFHELCAEEKLRKGEPEISSIGSLLCFGIGKNLLINYSELSDIRTYILGEAADFALIMISLDAVREKSTSRVSQNMFVKTVITVGIKTAFLVVYRGLARDVNFLSVILLTMGTAGIVLTFAQALERSSEISVFGFAAGLTISFCFDSLT